MNLKNTLLSLLFLSCFNYTYSTNYILVSKTGASLAVPDDPTASFVTTVTSLKAAHDYVYDSYGLNWEAVNLINQEVVIYVTGDTYNGEYIDWKASSPSFTLKIRAYPGHKPIFDGSQTNQNISRLLRVFNINDRSNQNWITNIHIEGLIIQNYINGIFFGGSLGDLTTQNGHNVIKNNIFRNIGNKFSNQKPKAVSALGMSHSKNNIIEGNIFYRIESTYLPGDLHAIYLSNNASNNLVKDNYVTLCSSDPFRIRNGSNNNTFENNYLDQSGFYAFISEWYKTPADYPNNPEVQSNGTVLNSNTCTFIYPENQNRGSISLFKSVSNSGLDNNYTDDGNNFIKGGIPECEVIGDVASGDIDDDGVDELFIGFNYVNFTKIVRSRPGMEPYLSKVLYKSNYWKVGALEMNDFDNDGAQELIVAFNALTNNTNNTQIFKGDGITSVSNQGLLYIHQWWTTADITSGDYDNNGSVEIFTAYNAPDNTGSDNTQIFKGTGEGTNPLGNLGQQFNHTWWRTAALTSGDYDGNGFEETYVAFNAPDTTGTDNTQIFKGTGVGNNPLGNLGQPFNDAWWKTADMTSGDYDNDGDDEIYVGLNAPDNSGSLNTKIIKGNGTNSVNNLGQYFSSSYWYTGSLATGNFDPGSGSSGQEIVTFFSGSVSTQMFYGNGTSSISNIGQNYRSEKVIMCDPGYTHVALKTRINPTDNSTSDIISVHPNPTVATNNFKITGISHNTKINIYSNSGVLVNTTIYTNNGIDVSSLAKGLYFIQIVGKDKFITKKLIIN